MPPWKVHEVPGKQNGRSWWSNTHSYYLTNCLRLGAILKLKEPCHQIAWLHVKGLNMSSYFSPLQEKHGQLAVYSTWLGVIATPSTYSNNATSKNYIELPRLCPRSNYFGYLETCINRPSYYLFFASCGQGRNTSDQSFWWEQGPCSISHKYSHPSSSNPAWWSVTSCGALEKGGCCCCCCCPFWSVCWFVVCGVLFNFWCLPVLVCAFCMILFV